MTKQEARIWVHALLVKTLRQRASALTARWAAMVSGHKDVLTDKQVEKLRIAMIELADKLEEKLVRMKGGTDEGGHDGAAPTDEGPVADAAEGAGVAEGLPR